MRVGWKHLGAALVALFAGGMLVAWLGVVDIRASSGHWKATDWFLHWAMGSSVRTAALGTDVPSLDDPAYLPLAAGHFETACTDCHGSPERPRSPAVLRMLPPPPDLKDVVNKWTDAQLFEIVRHGIRYTGMPAWPAENRDDEVWAMVAFLRNYPAIDAERYRQLAGLTTEVPGSALQAQLAKCDACHAADRMSGDSRIPMLDGQSETYLLESLEAFSTGARPSGVMQTVVNGLDDAEMQRLAAHYASQSARSSDEEGSAPELVRNGDARRKIPACHTCHDRPGLNPAFPRLAGQSRSYLSGQLRLFVAGTRGGTRYSGLMTSAAHNLTEAEIDVLSRHYARSPNVAYRTEWNQ